MTKVFKTTILVLIATFVVIPKSSYGLSFIYPNQGQSEEQKNKDIRECSVSAKEQTGFDPIRSLPKKDTQLSPQEQQQRQQSIQAYNQSLADCLQKRGYIVSLGWLTKINSVDET